MKQTGASDWVMDELRRRGIDKPETLYERFVVATESAAENVAAQAKAAEARRDELEQV